MEEMAVLPVYESVHFNEDGDLIGIKEIPKYYLMDEGD